MSKRRNVGWILVEVLLVGWAVACGQVEDSDGPSSDDTDSDSDATAAGGWSPMSTGGASSGGADTFEYGSGGQFDEWGSCADIPESLLAPPCSEEDLVVPGECAFDEIFEPGFPVSGLTTPTGALRLLLLPVETSTGFGGQGGSSGELSPIPLTVWISPSSAGEVENSELEGSSFVLTESEATVYSSFAYSEVAPYLHRLSPEPEFSWPETFTVARLALVDGERVLLERRVIFEPDFGCLVK